MGALLLALVAAMTLFVVEHNIAQAQASDVATLNSLTVTDTTISSMMPAFVPDAAPAADGYVVYVANAVSSVTVTAGVTHTGSTVGITADTDADNDTNTESPQNITLATGSDNETEIMVKVTAQDGFATATYTINVMKVSGASLDAMLSSLSVTAGGKNLTLTPSFMPDGAPAENGYMASVSAATSSVVVNAVTSHTGATVKTSSETQTGDGVNDSFRLKAAGMATEIMVKVTAQDKATILTYMITVTRASNTASTDADLRSLGLTMADGDDADNDPDPVNLTPSFVGNSGPASGGYSASVGSGITAVTLTASSSHAGSVVTVMAEGTGASVDNDADATDGEYSGAITLATSGATDIEVKVTAEDGVAEAKYMITVSKEAADAGPSDDTLKKLSVMAGSTELINGFASGTTTYTGNVAAATSSVRVDAVSSNSRAGVQVTSDAAGRVTGNGPYTAPLGAAGQGHGDHCYRGVRR